MRYPFLPFFAVFLVWFLDRVAKLYYFYYWRVNVIHTSNVTSKRNKVFLFMLLMINLFFSLNRVSFFGFGP